ncbi:GH-E family nuclease [Mycobacteroides abscessus]
MDNGHRLIEWQPGDPRIGLWDMGHVEGREYAPLRERYLSGQLTFEEFMQQYRDPENYRVQDPYRNRSHIDEGP